MKSRDSIIKNLAYVGRLHVACLKAHQGQWQSTLTDGVCEKSQYFAGKLGRERKQLSFLEYAKQKEENNTSISCHWTWNATKE